MLDNGEAGTWHKSCHSCEKMFVHVFDDRPPGTSKVVWMVMRLRKGADWRRIWHLAPSGASGSLPRRAQNWWLASLCQDFAPTHSVCTVNLLPLRVPTIAGADYELPRRVQIDSADGRSYAIVTPVMSSASFRPTWPDAQTGTGRSQTTTSPRCKD